MTIVRKSRIVGYSCEQMYNLVNDIERYAEFVPHCSDSMILHRDKDELQATLVIAAAGFSKSFTTRNRLQTNKMIEIRLVDGPFSHLEGFWRFDEVDEGCQVSCDIEFEFAGSMLSMLISPVFDQVVNKMVDAFCDRAEEIYG